MRIFAPFLLVFCFACASTSKSTDLIDWQAIGVHWSVHIVTIDPDGSERTTRIWLATDDDHGSLRTGDSRWWQNLERDADCRIRVARRDYSVHAVLVTEQEDKVRIDEAFEAKYGWLERLMFSQDRGETHENYAYLRAGESS